MTIQQDLNSLLNVLGISKNDFNGKVNIVGRDPIVYSPHRVAEATALALAAQAVAVSALWKLRSGRNQNIKINIKDALHQLHSIDYLKINSHKIALHVIKEAITDFYRCADGRWVFFTGSYAHLRNGILELLRCANTRTAITNAVSQWQAQDLEDALAEHGLTGAMVRSEEEWLLHPQGRILAELPVVEIEKIADSPPKPLPKGKRPLSGIKVLDFTHVIAGPLCTRGLAEQGADVLHVQSPLHEDPLAMVIDVNHGKHSAYIDLDCLEDVSTLRKLVQTADVFAESWRPGVLARKGYSAQELAEVNPGIISLSVSAYGRVGPWAVRGGFDQQGQVVTGIAAEESSLTSPRLSPVYYLNDYLTAYLASAGIAAALLRRAKEGGSYHVRVALARTSMWVHSLGHLAKKDIPTELREKDLEPPKLEVCDTAFGKFEYLASAIQYSETPAKFDLPPAPLGAHLPQWQNN